MAGKTANWKPGPTVCRCCLAEGCYKDISTEYFWMGKREVYAEMLTNTFNVSIAFSQSGGPNSNSRLICEPCISRLRDASNFKRQVLDCEKTFMQHLDPGSSLSHQDLPEELAGLDDAVKVERVKIERDAPSDDDFDATPDFLDDDDDELDQPLTNFATKEPKKEAVSLLEELLDNPAVTIKKKSVVKTKQPPAKKVKRTETAKPTSSKVVAKTATAEKKKKGPEIAEIPRQGVVPLFQVEYDRTLCKPLGVISDFGKLKQLKEKQTEEVPKTPLTKFQPDPKQKIRAIHQNILTVFECSTAYPFMFWKNKFKCFVCPETFLGLVSLKHHMSEHDLTPIKRLVRNRKEIVVRVDISDLSCKICSMQMNDLDQMRLHLKESHQKPIDLEVQDNMVPFDLTAVNEGYKCVICKEIFMKIRVLVFHMTTHFSKYSCDVCGSGFMTLRLLKTHLKAHETGTYPCDTCEKTFNTPLKRKVHIRNAHSKVMPLKCPMCPERFKCNFRKVKHLQDVHNQVTRVYKCPTCDRSFHVKYHLVLHIRSVHQQDRRHQCDICSQTFTLKNSLTRHMKIHAGERKFKCDVCGKDFVRRSHLKVHSKKHGGVFV